LSINRNRWRRVFSDYGSVQNRHWHPNPIRQHGYYQNSGPLSFIYLLIPSFPAFLTILERVRCRCLMEFLKNRSSLYHISVIAYLSAACCKSNKSSPKSFGKSRVATPHGRKWTRPLRVPAVQCPLQTSPISHSAVGTTHPQRSASATYSA